METISKQEKQLKQTKNKKKEVIKRDEKGEKSKKIVLLRDSVGDIFMKYDMSITDKGEDILRKLVKNEEKLIDYHNLFFETGNRAKNIDFLKRFGTLYDLLIDLLNQQINIKEAKKEQV